LGAVVIVLFAPFAHVAYATVDEVLGVVKVDEGTAPREPLALVEVAEAEVAKVPEVDEAAAGELVTVPIALEASLPEVETAAEPLAIGFVVLEAPAYSELGLCTFLRRNAPMTLDWVFG
jgi:hypothetical protein